MKRLHNDYHIDDRNTKRFHDINSLIKYHKPNSEKAINKQICDAKNVDELIRIYKRNKADFTYINLCTTIHRFTKHSKNGNRNNQFIVDLIPDIIINIKYFEARNIANLAWSFAKLKIKNIELFDLLAEETKYKIRDFNSQNISNLAWSFATLGIKNSKLFDLLVEETKHKIGNCITQNLTNLAWSFATLGIKNVELFDLLAEETKVKIRDFNSQEIENLAWSFATLGIRDIKLFDLLAEETKYKIKDFNSQDIANLAWSFATLGAKNIKLFDLLTEETKFKIKDFNSRDIVNLTWSFAVLNAKNIELFELLIKNVNSTKNFELLQLYYVYLHCRYELKSENLASSIIENFSFDRALSNRDVKSSNFHLDCVLHFELLNIEYQNEIDINGLHCDIYMLNTNTIIEINGPSHYAHLDDHPLGPTIFKERLLRAMGYKVKTIPWWDWDDLDDSEEKKDYITKLLQ